MVDGGSGSIASGKYTIERALGRGGMGEVYLARDTRLNRQVAIKYLRRDLPDGNWRERLQREAQLLAKLNHPNIVQIYDLVEQDGVPALVMEYVDGRNLRIHLREHRAELGERLRWLSEIATGVAASHEQGIAHCDLKQENVLISPAGTAKVSDFGIASDSSDAGADMAALGRIAEAVLSDYRDRLSPALGELLVALTHSDSRQQLSAGEAAERFRLAWYETSQEETPLPGDLAAPGRRRSVAVAALAAAILVMATAAIWLLREPAASRYVAVLPPAMALQDAATEQQARYLRTAVTQSLRQNVIDSPGLALASFGQSEVADADPAALLDTLGIDSLLASSLSCNLATCEFTLERLDAPDGTVTAHASTTLLIDSTLGAAYYLNKQWPELFPDSDWTPVSDSAITSDQYRVYLELYLDAEQAAAPLADLVPSLEALLAEVDDFLPLYLLYSRVAIDAFEFMGDAGYLDRLENRLAAGERRLTDTGALDRAWFNLYRARNDTVNTARMLEAIVTRDPDPALDSFLRGQLQAAGHNFAEAAPLFARATSLQPSSAHYYAWARSVYFANDKDQALSILDQMLSRYPYSTRALNLKGAALFEQWRLDEATEAWGAILAIQDDAMVRTNLGSAYLFRGDYRQARAHFEIAYASESRDASMLLNLADSERLLENADRAERLYNEVIERFEAEDPNVYPEIAAQAYAQMGRYEEALTVVNQYETQWQGHAIYAFSNALVYTLAGQQIAAVVKVGEALGGGLAPGFFSLPWFDRLCGQSRFVELLAEAGDNARCDGQPGATPG